MRSIVTILALAAISAGAQARAGEITAAHAFDIGAWSGQRHLSASGVLLYCTASTAVAGTDAISIRLEPSGRLGIAVSRRDWKFSKKTVEADFVIDHVIIATRATVGAADMLYVMFDPPDDRAVYDRLGKGTALAVQTRKGSQTFDLAPLAKVLPALGDCTNERSPASGNAALPAARPTGATPAATPFDVPGATRIDKSQVMAIMANSMAGPDNPRYTFLLADELASLLPGYDVGWRTETGVMGSTAVRGRVDQAEANTIIGNLIALDVSRCSGKMRIEINPPEEPEDTPRNIHAYCDGGGNSKETHYLIWTFNKGGIMITRFEPISMKDPGSLLDDIYSN
jgi:hypothetical protein